MLDLSRVKMHSVEPSLLVVFPKLRSLNLSDSGAELLQWNSSQMPVESMQKLDLRGCVTAEFHQDLLRGFFQLQLFYTDDFKLCCQSVLPPGFDLRDCHVTPDDVSSCDDLLGSVSYLTGVALLATLAVLGNVVSLSVRVCVGSAWRLSKGGVVLTQLSVADLGTGLYLTTLGLADRLLASYYIWHDNAWRRGAVCQLAGGLALSCRHASTFFITILTLHRCFHHFPTLIHLFTPAKVKVTCILVWVSSFILAAVPFTSQWQFFGQQALCVPLPHRGTNSAESDYVYAVLVLVQFIMFVLCSGCEGATAVRNRVRNSSIVNKSSSPKDCQFVVLGSLCSGFLNTITSLVSTDFHSDSQRVLHTALVFFGSVVSCAMNPYLHLYGVRAERNKRIKEKRLLMIVNRVRV